MGYWQSKVVPKIKKVFEKNSVKKAAAAEACKSFDDSKEEYSKEFEEKKTELQPKVIEIYEAAATEIKTLVKEPKATRLKKYSAGVEKFLDELAKLEYFPGSKPAYEATTNFGATYVSGPIFFVFEKVSTFIVTEETKEVEVPAPETAAATTTEEISGTEKEKETVVEVEKKEEAAAPEPEKTEPLPPPVAAEPPKA